MRHLFRFVSVVTIVLVFAVASQAEKVWKVTGGTTCLFFFDSILKAHGFNVARLIETAVDPEMMENSVAFKILPESTLNVRSQDGIFKSFDSGEIQCRGGFVLGNPLGNISELNFKIKPNGPLTTDGLKMYVGSNPLTPFRLDLGTPVSHFYPNNAKLDIGCADLKISPEYANHVNRPELANLLIGVITIMTELELEASFGTDNDWRDPITQGTIDLGLLAMQSLTTVGRIGTFPNGRNGLSMQTTSCNLGNMDIPWNAPMQETHPVICMNLYRTYNGRFEHIGMSWLKHGFLSTNGSDPNCGTCIHPGTGTLLGPGCTDTYFTGNNADRRYLGPREELNPFTGHWTCLGSWFTNYQNDCIRRNTGSGLDAVAHRLEVDDVDLNLTGAQFYYEAYYINENESNKYNQIGYRRATPSWTGSTWTFSTNTTMTLGPAINVWGDVRATALPRTEGDVIVAQKTTDLGANRYRYDYAVYIHDLDRQVREFSLPIESGLEVSNIGFRDVDKDPVNDWSSSYSNGVIKWSTQTHAQNPNANSLKYGRVFNYWFEVNRNQVSSNATLGLFKPGTLQSLNATIPGPPPPIPAPISGQLVLADYDGPTPLPNAEFQLKVAGGTTTTSFSGVTLDPNGQFTFSTTLRGEFDLYAKATHWLQKKRVGSITIGAAGVSGILLSLMNGDVNEDNEVNLVDFGAVASAFGSVSGDSNWLANADLNGDEEVNLVDVGIVAGNFGQSGD